MKPTPVPAPQVMLGFAIQQKANVRTPRHATGASAQGLPKTIRAMPYWGLEARQSTPRSFGIIQKAEDRYNTMYTHMLTRPTNQLTGKP
jgi:hypothetical protein